MKRGFTLVELIAVIVILAIILTISMPTISNIITNVKEKVYIANEETLVDAAEIYTHTNSVSLPKEIYGQIRVKLSDLEASGLLNKIIDPNNRDTECDGYVTIEKVNSGEYDYRSYLKCGDNYKTEGYTEFPTYGLILHLDAMDINLPDGAEVSQWIDKVNSRVVTGASYNNGRKPIFVTNYNNKPTIQFNGNSDGSYFDIGTSINAESIFIVFQIDSDTPGFSCIITSQLNNYPWSIRMSGSSWINPEDQNGWVYPENVYYVDSVSGPSIPDTTQLHVLYAEKGSNNASEKAFRYIGSSEYSNNRWYKGRISEIMMYDYKLDTEQREEVENYLGKKWLGW